MYNDKSTITKGDRLTRKQNNKITMDKIKISNDMQG